MFAGAVLSIPTLLLFPTRNRCHVSRTTGYGLTLTRFGDPHDLSDEVAMMVTAETVCFLTILGGGYEINAG